MLAIVLIPSAALLITGASVTGVLISDAVAARDFSGYLGTIIQPLLQSETVLQQERTVSLRALGGDPQAIAALPAQRNTTDTVLNQAGPLASAMQDLNPDAMAESNAVFLQLIARMPVIRQGVDARQASPADVDNFYTQFSGAVASSLEGMARTTPDPEAAAEEITAADLFWVTDLHSRAVGLAAGGAAQGVLSPADRLTVAQLAGGYRHQLEALVSRLTDTGKARHDKLVESDAWKLTTANEDNLAQRGTLSVPLGDWLAAEDQVSTELNGLWSDHFSYAESVAESAANQSLFVAILAGSLVLVLAIGAFLIAVRLANALVRRLRTLRTKTLELADETLPAMVGRLADGERVDVEAEILMLDDGTDEIGQVAEAFNSAQRTAIAAAMAEARTRSGINKVFLDIAHRSQTVVHRQLEVLDVAEAKQGDPEHLELLFQLDHLATHARRNAENLLILGGGQPGRKWRKPVALEEIVRSAISETQDFARVSAVRLPDVNVLGGVVADLIHLLAELVDNATSFSPPDAPVSVRGNLVGKGVVVEVEDQGLGIGFEERERLNGTLSNPPDFQEMALAGQRHLGLFVIGQLAQRHGIAVSLLESAYGGIKAIVLIPAKVLDGETDGTTSPDRTTSPEDTASTIVVRRSGRHHQPPSHTPERAQDPVPRTPQKKEPQLQQWPMEEPAAGPVSLPPARTSFESSEPTPVLDPTPTQSPTRKRAPLPRRQRQANLAPQLQLDASAPTAAEPRRLRSPDDARSSMSSFQRGTHQGRDSSGQHNR